MKAVGYKVEKQTNHSLEGFGTFRRTWTSILLPENWLLKYLQISREIWYPNSSISYGVTMEAEVETFQK